MLRPLGYQLVKVRDTVVGFGVEDIEGKRDFWLHQRREIKDGSLNNLSCLAFQATSKEMVNAFYVAGIEVGGKDNGAPGYYVEYHPGYYAAYVFDLDGNNIEAVYDDSERTT